LIDTPSLISLLAYNTPATHTYLVTHSEPITIRLGFFIHGPRERLVSANGSLPWRLDTDSAVLTRSVQHKKCTSNKSSLVNKKGNVEEFIRAYNLNPSFRYYVIKERKNNS
jgi:hypothetical protein